MQKKKKKTNNNKKKKLDQTDIKKSAIYKMTLKNFTGINLCNFNNWSVTPTAYVDYSAGKVFKLPQHNQSF